ncbi:MAG: ABC transporter permease [Pseudomonadota bacterium]
MTSLPKTADFEAEKAERTFHMAAKGLWTAPCLGPIDGRLRTFTEKTLDHELIIDLGALEGLDTAGAMMLQRTMSACGGRTDESRFVNAAPEHMTLLVAMTDNLAPCPTEPPQRNAFILMLNRVGQGVENVYFSALHILNFIGVVISVLWRILREPKRLRLTSTFHHMEEAGLDAVPIVGLMSFLIGAVVAFMGAKVLQQFGAEIFTVDLIGVAVLREFGVLLTAILIAGRSGSAFTAQIGSMKVREEIDAMRALGLDPVEVLVAPRVIALLLMLPLLTFVAGMLGMVGGALVAWSSLNITPGMFMARTQEVIVLSNFWVGMIKAPFFAFIIAVIGCFQGTQVEGSAESVGQRTTLSVVQAIFVVIMLDAFFAMFFLEIDF